MRFVLIHAIMQSTRRLRSKLHLPLPSDADQGPRRKDLTGYIFVLLALALAVATFLLY